VRFSQVDSVNIPWFNKSVFSIFKGTFLSEKRGQLIMLPSSIQPLFAASNIPFMVLFGGMAGLVMWLLASYREKNSWLRMLHVLFGAIGCAFMFVPFTLLNDSPRWKWLTQDIIGMVLWPLTMIVGGAIGVGISRLLCFLPGAINNLMKMMTKDI
jgi:hypothetical protein